MHGVFVAGAISDIFDSAIGYLWAVLWNWWGLALAILAINEVAEWLSGKSMRWVHRHRIKLGLLLIVLAQAFAYYDLKSGASQKSDGHAKFSRNFALSSKNGPTKPISLGNITTLHLGPGDGRSVTLIKPRAAPVLLNNPKPGKTYDIGNTLSETLSSVAPDVTFTRIMAINPAAEYHFDLDDRTQSVAAGNRIFTVSLDQIVRSEVAGGKEEYEYLFSVSEE
jgi:hypothetical protein